MKMKLHTITTNHYKKKSEKLGLTAASEEKESTQPTSLQYQTIFHSL